MDNDSPKSPFGSISIAPGGPNKELPEQIKEELKIEESKTDEKETGPSFPRRKTGKRSLKWLKWTLFSVAIGFSLFLLIGYALIPYIFSTYIPKKMSVQLERPVTIGSVKFNPFTLNLKMFNGIIGPRITNPEDKVDPVFSFGSWIINLEAISLLKMGIVCKDISIDSFFLHVVRQSDTTLNVRELLSPAFFSSVDSQNDGEKSTTLEFPFQYSLNNINITNGHLIFQDIPSGKTHAIEEIRLALPALSNFEYTAAEYIRPEFSAKVDGSPIGITGQTGIAGKSIDTTLQLHLESVDIPSYLAYLPNGPDIVLKKGKAALEIDVHFSAEKTGKGALQLTGSAYMFDLQIQDNASKGIFNIPTLAIKGTASPFTGRYHFKEMVLQKPEFHLVRAVNGDFGLPDLSWLISLDGPEKGKKTDESQRSLRIDRMDLQNGKVVFVDQTLTGKNKESWSGIQLTVSDYTVSKDEEARKPAIYKLEGMKENGRNSAKTSFKSQGVIYTLPLRVEGNIQADGIDLSSYESYQGIGAHSEESLLVKGGRADFKGKFVFQNGKDVSNNGLVISEVRGKVANFFVTKHNGFQFKSPSFIFKKALLDTGKRNINFGVVTSDNTTLGFGNRKLSKTSRKEISVESGKEKNEGLAEKKESWKVGLQSLNMNRLIFEDMGTIDPTKKENYEDSLSDLDRLQLEDVFIQVSDYSQQGGLDDLTKRLSGSARFKEKGRIHCVGNSKFSPFDAELECSVADLKLTSIQPLFNFSYLQDVSDGYLQAKGTFGLPNFSFFGSLAIHNLKIKSKMRASDGKERDRFRWQEASGKNVRITSNPYLLTAETVTIEKPFIDYSIETDGSPFKRRSALSNNNLNQDPAGEYDLNIEEIRLNGGEISLADESLSPPYHTNIIGINGYIKELSSLVGNRAQMTLHGLQDGSAQLDADCQINLFVANRAAECNFKGSGIDVSSLSSYLEPHLGEKIASGSIQFIMKYSLDQGIVTADNNLDIHNFSLGDNRRTDSPLSLAAALLMDNDKHIFLNIPVRGDLRDQDFAFRTSLIKGLRSLLARAAVSPFLILDELIRTKQSAQLDNQFFERFFFPFGKIEMDEKFEKNLELFAWVLQQRPALVLEITGYADGKKDRAALLALRKKQAAFDRVVKEIQMSDLITKEYGSEEISPSIQSKGARKDEGITPKRSEMKVDDKELLQLATERSKKVGKFLIEKLKVSPKQIVVSKRSRLIAGSAFGRPGNRVDFNMTAMGTGSN